ncbi:3-hydroxybutyryl-CoA dehydrogenase [Aurantimonas sp. VKM B-3413]|uniref:3-hydroxybutyryl-CoA dehydrogenase n=1 Tax=Aurantimonas sp. VKM B-3413 TaxID=2779401 RepID=UPI001E517E0D|nr:3-hydroxybutyryl-CoA dehydrogenase [Aurantimonas sp. VKM B-3413]MCB8840307.1 3-hydroxybutyryl-CoA dehydrogenase [Aurantimonas sp. VKM B-3413]
MAAASARPVVACVGAGRMGRGIAHAFAYAGYVVRLIDAKPREPQAFAEMADAARAEIRGSLAMVAGLGGFDAGAIEPIMARISIVPLDEAETALADARFVFEAVPETDAAKRAGLELIDRLASADAIVASTTSTYLSTQLAAWSGRPGRFLNAHWLNPAFIVPLVEVSPTGETDPAVVTELNALFEAIGKVPVVCKASPGYIVPRIQALAMNEAARLVEEGVASAEDIDKAVKYGFGFRFAVLGLLEFIDWGGGDILYHASRYMTDAMGDRRFAAPAIVEANMAEGRNGLRDGVGFYDYAAMDVPAYRQERMAEFLGMLTRSGLHRPPAQPAEEKGAA